MMTNLINKLILACVLMSLSGCAAWVASGAAATGQIATDKRTSGHILDDIVIKGRLTNRYSSDVQKRFSNVTVKVSEARVLLTGKVDGEAAKHDAVKMAWNVKGVREVIDEITTNDETSALSKAKDMLIKSRIKSKFLLRRGFRSANYTVIVTDKIVYLFGIAEDEAEKSVAADIARRIKGVERVVNYVILKDDPRRV